MNSKPRSVLTVDDLANHEMEAIFSLADTMHADMKAQYGLCRGMIMASLFFEPSTRTRLSFEAAMNRLGGSVITAADIEGTSLAKGESIADMARVVGSYADLIVIRHPWEGAAKVVADYSGVPVINAGDGGHEHPTQTLCDLYTLKKEKGSLKGLKIALWGDLKYGRTTHSLAFALARFGATILFRSSPGLELPAHVAKKLTREYKGELKKYEALGQVVRGGVLPVEAVYMTPDSPHQLAMIPDVSLELELESGVDALYVTRLQKERLSAMTDQEGNPPHYPVVDKKLLGEKGFKEALVMHPLPRVDELAHDLDADERSMYFRQAARGVPVRMALIAHLLGVKGFPPPPTTGRGNRSAPYIYRHDSGLICANPQCVSVQGPEVKYIKQLFHISSFQPPVLTCAYCEHEIQPPYIATTEKHEGRGESPKYHNAKSHWTTEIKQENLVFFSSAEAAEAQGYKPSYYA
ncbi:aspartate carbamoyltransferase catalytic subunit [Chloroflexota bacterium]